LQKGVSVSPRFADNGDGTVKDNLTGLIWLRDPNCFVLSWTDALAASKTLASGACGLTDGSVAGAWRLPNIKELQSLTDFGQAFPALPPGHPFSGVWVFWFWSSDSDEDSAWASSLYEGRIGREVKYRFAAVWPIRGGQ